MALPLDIRDLVSSGKKYQDERDKPLRIAVFIDAEAPDEAVALIKDALRPQTVFARMHIEPVAPGDFLEVDSSADAVIAVAGPGATLEQSLAAAREKYIPTVVVALGDSRDHVSRRLFHPLRDVVVKEDADDLLDALALWLVERVPAKKMAIANNFAFVRHAVAEEAVKNTSIQNGLIAGVSLIPGADMPLLTANQAKMILQIAAAYGQTLGAERIKELAVVVGGGFALRTVARQLVGLIPGFGWALKAAVGYSGTLAMGYAATEYFERGGDVRGLGETIRRARDKAVSTARRREREEQVATTYVEIKQADSAGDDRESGAGSAVSSPDVETGGR